MASRNTDSNEQEGRFRAKPRLHGEFLATSLLAMLRDWNAHGYQLAKRLGDLGLPRNLPSCSFGSALRLVITDLLESENGGLT